MPSPLANDPARAAVSRRKKPPKISANPREGGGGEGDGDAVVPPSPVCVRPGDLPACVTPVLCVPPLARWFPLGKRGERGGLHEPFLLV